MQLFESVRSELDKYPQDGGIPSVGSVLEALVAEHGETKLLKSIKNSLLLAWEASVEELVQIGVIGSAEVLARVSPQLTAQISALGFGDATLRELVQQITSAFRRRRSLLLRNLESQVRLSELPWISALQPLKEKKVEHSRVARQSLENLTLLTLSTFPYTCLPNPMVQELASLASQAGMKLPWLKEIAADIFEGTFQDKWKIAAAQTAKYMKDSLYADYYDLPQSYAAVSKSFVQLCEDRSQEARHSGDGWVAENGTILEQSQILTSHNLTQLIFGFGLEIQAHNLAPDWATECFQFIIDRQQQIPVNYLAKLQLVKNCAYAWRQGLFFLSLCDDEVVKRILEDKLPALPDHYAPVVLGLRSVLEGQRFDKQGFIPGTTGRRFLGWSVGDHFLIPKM